MTAARWLWLTFVLAGPVPGLESVRAESISAGSVQTGSIQTGSIQTVTVPVWGFGHGTLGGAGGHDVLVTRMDDHPEAPRPGSLRWALNQSGPLTVRFERPGTVRLKAPLVLNQRERITLDGRTSAGLGVCLRGAGLVLSQCRDVLITHLRVRPGDERVLRQLKAEGLSRPRHSSGLDCIEVRDCERVVLDHLSLTWSCDELLSVIRSRGVSVQWCLLGEPLGDPRLHPYGDRHAFGILASASQLSLHHCVLTHYWMRGPQFEANDMRLGDRWPVEMEAVSNVFSDYGRSGSRYTAGAEDRHEEAEQHTFRFHFEGNAYLDAANAGRGIEVVTKHGLTRSVRMWAQHNWSLDLETRSFRPLVEWVAESGTPVLPSDPWHGQRSNRPLFRSPRSPRSPEVDLVGAGLGELLDTVGAQPRDAVDGRLIEELLSLESRPVLGSQDDVGGWPHLGGGLRLFGKGR